MSADEDSESTTNQRTHTTPTYNSGSDEITYKRCRRNDNEWLMRHHSRPREQFVILLHRWKGEINKSDNFSSWRDPVSPKKLMPQIYRPTGLEQKRRKSTSGRVRHPRGCISFKQIIYSTGGWGGVIWRTCGGVRLALGAEQQGFRASTQPK